MMAWIVTLFVGGILLLLAELFLPGLVCGILGTIMLIASMVLSVKAAPEFALAIIIGESALALAIFVFGLWFVPRFGARWGYAHTKNMDADAGYVNVPENPALIGRTGTVATFLRPAGIAEIDGERLDVVTTGDFIEAGVAVRVIAVEGNRIVVERAE